jgi:hypothetical protein
MNFLYLNYLKIRNFFKLDKKGMGTVETIIIIAVLVALALLFKTFILDMSETIFDKIRDKTNAAIDGL